MKATKTINLNGKTYEVQHNSYFAEVATCIETGEVYTSEAFYQRHGYDNRFRGNKRVTCLASVENQKRSIEIAKSDLF